MFSFMVNTFKAVNYKEKSIIFKDKKRKANENYAFDDDIFDAFNLNDNVCNKNETTNTDSDEEEISHSILYTESNTLDNVCTNSLYSIRSILLGHSEKKQQLEQALPVITGWLQSRLHPSHTRKIQILLDSRTQGTNTEIQSFNLTSCRVIAR
jgi:hypothetical protein